MSTRIHQTWDLGDGELTFDLSHAQPLPAAAFPILADLASHMRVAAAALRDLLDKPTEAREADSGV